MILQETKKAAIRCGSCKGTHPSVAEVRACFGAVKEPPATEPMRNYCQSLLRQRVPTGEYEDVTEDRINAFSKKEAGHFIDTMKKQPLRRNRGLPELPHPEVPEGYYAIQREGEVVDFFKVVDWKDTRLLFQVFGAPGSFEERKVTRPEIMNTVMAAIAADMAGASALFGKELGVCGRCGSPLTSKWRKLGIGPDCSKKGW